MATTTAHGRHQRHPLRRLCLSVAAVALAIGLAPSAAAAPPAYLAVIDAGSSGTRLTLYGTQADSLVPVEVTKAKTSTKGLSSFAASPAQAGPAAVTPLLEQLDAYLAAQGIAKSEVPVALLATAGMRNVRRDDRAAAQAILDSTAAAIAASGHAATDNRILPAVQEATLAWLDANALAGTVDKEKGSIGIIEVGGASAQVAFRSPVATGRAVREVRVDGRVIPVVAVSYLGLGANDARSLMQADNDAGAFCFPNNAAGSQPATYVSSSARPVDASSAQYSWDRCTRAYAGTITTVGKDRTAAASVPPATLRTLPGFTTADFVGLGNLLFTYGDLDIASASNERTSLRRATTTACAGSDAWTKVLALYQGRSAAFADTICSTATYQYELLFGDEGVGVSPARFTTDDSGFSRGPAWTSGYAITVLSP
jgi:hypothetical protein